MTCVRHILLRCLAVAVALAGSLVPVGAEAPKPGPPRAAVRDLQLTVHGRRALQEDGELAALNLGVRVRDGVATLWGPVPSVHLIARAVQRLEAVQGILEVKTELYVARPEKKNDLLAFPLAPDERLRSESASPNPESGIIGGLSGRTVSGPEPAVASRPAASLLAPVPIEAALAATPPVAPPAQLASQPLPSHPDRLLLAVERVRRGDARFRTLRTEVKGSTILVTGAAAQGDEVMALAQTLSRLPGVERVITRNDAGPVP